MLLLSVNQVQPLNLPEFKTPYPQLFAAGQRDIQVAAGYVFREGGLHGCVRQIPGENTQVMAGKVLV